MQGQRSRYLLFSKISSLKVRTVVFKSFYFIDYEANIGTSTIGPWKGLTNSNMGGKECA